MTSRSSFGSRGQQQHLELLDQPGLVPLQTVDLLARHRPHLFVAVARVAELTHAGELGADRLQAPIGIHGRREPRQLLAQTADLVRIGAGLRS